MVIIGIPTFGNLGLKEVMNNRFGRCASFTFVTIENNEIVEVRSVANDAQGAMGGAGTQAAQIIGNNGATEVIVGNLGPNASYSLNALNIKIYQAQGGSLTVKELIDLLTQVWAEAEVWVEAEAEAWAVVKAWAVAVEEDNFN
jgi:predicted Fe-Mo cluster-binding NifX family protein